MQNPVVSREEWLAARIELLKAEKDLTRRSDALAQRRQELPWVRIDKTYQFETEAGKASLPDLFQGRSQLLVYHFMFGPDYKAGCPSCSSIADGFDGFVVHLANHDVTLMAISRAPLEKLQGYKQRMGWTFPWASSYGSDFNFDFNVSLTEEAQRNGTVEYNYEREEPVVEIASRTTPDGTATFAAMSGTDTATYARERPESVPSCWRMVSSTTPIRPIRAAWTVCGACTNGSTAHQKDATKMASGGVATMNTHKAESPRF